MSEHIPNVPPLRGYRNRRNEGEKRTLADEIANIVAGWGMHAEGIRLLNENVLPRVRALEAEAATLRAERDKLRGVVKDWLALHDESERDEVVLLRVSREVGQLSDDGEHLLALRTDLLAFRDRFRQALDHTTPAPSGAKESDGERRIVKVDDPEHGWRMEYADNLPGGSDDG